MCADRVAAGKLPMCVQHCQAWCLYHGEVEELAAQDGRLVALRAVHALSPSKAMPAPGARAWQVREGGDARGSSVFYS